MANTPVPPIPTLTFPNDIPIFRFWLQRMLPTVYTDSLSYSELLGKVIDYLNSVVSDQNEVNADLESLYDYVKELHDLLVEWMQHGFDEYYRQQVQQWIDDHLKWIFDHLIRHVFFGLTQDGYFCAYIPASWATIQFDTIMDYSNPNYGHLVLKY